MHGKKL